MKKPIIIPVEKQEDFKQLKEFYKGTKNDVKFVEVADEVFDRLEKGLSCLDKKMDNDEDWYIFFTDKQLKDFFGFTDEEIKNLHKNKKLLDK